MNSRSTWFWVALAGGLFAFIFFFERHLQKPAIGPMKILPRLTASAVTSIQILPKGKVEIRAERTNGAWRLTSPFSYPARPDRVQELLVALESLTPATSITAQELKNVPKADERYGFEPPQNTLVLRQGEDQTFIHLGYRTAPGDQLFVQVVGIGEVYVVDADLLKLIPARADDWRDPRLVDLMQIVSDRLLVTNAGKAFELQRNPTNQLWRIILPGWETRADSDKVREALTRLQDLRAIQFVSDDPKADLDSLGLQAPELSLAFAQGTNAVLQLHFGKSPTNDTGQIYARRSDENSVITVSKDALAPWRASYDVFRDRHLVTMTGPLDSIEVRAQDHFTIERGADNTWRILPGGVAADPELVDAFIRNLGDLQVSEIVKDVVTAPDLPNVGLASPSRQFTLRAAVTNAAAGITNRIIAQLDFGTNQDDRVYARRTDESSLYTVTQADLALLPSASWQLRERRIWHFDESDVARILIHQDGRTREVVRNGVNSWSLAPGSQGIINDLAMDEVAHQLGGLTAESWIAQGDENRARYGFTTNSLRVEVELKTGRKLSVEFGATAPSGSTYALTALDDRPWIFEFPWRLYHQYVQTYLTIPATLH
jgi:hypothetical protein